MNASSIPLILCLALTAFSAHSADDAEQLFVRRIQPLFAEKCLGCHGDDTQKIKADYDMRSLASALKGGESGAPAIVPGQAEKSPLYLSVTRTHDDWEAMPPKDPDKLYAEQIEWIKDWIAGGAPWPEAARAAEIAKANAEKWSAEDGAPVKTSGGLSSDWTNRKYKPESLWGYQPVKKPEIRSPKSEHPVDALLALHLPEGLQPAPEADARTLIRRATFDLTGLPPRPEEVAAFEADWSVASDKSAAWLRLINRLLDSPHYGERMAQHWLDVTRYADSSGFANDYERGNAWRYRDYVVRAFNSDKPYDQFIREQIAGDELDPNDPEKLVATGFLRMGPWELTGMEVAKVARQRFLDDVTNAVGETFLAHSLQCARCHDHKFDPVPTRDYYAIQAVFSTTQLAERAAPFLPQENTRGFEERVYLEKTRAEHLATLKQLNEVLLKNAQTWFADNGKDPARWNAAVAAASQPSAIKQAKSGKRSAEWDTFGSARQALTNAGVPESEFPPKLVGFTPEQFGMERVARKGLERLQWELDRYEPFALAVYNGLTREFKTVNAPLRMPQNRMTDGELEEGSILIGGDPFSAGPKVEPGVLSALTSMDSLEFQIAEGIEGRRKAFADWVASASNPLTTRTLANRLWLWHFGQPIAGNPNNFGSTGKPPTHPELLDFLAATLVEKSWSFKAMHRLIMTSAAYRRSAQFAVQGAPLSREDLEKAYAVFKPRRLSAEELRDAMLAASGELNPALGGIPNRPEINLEAALQPRQVMGTFASAWVPNPRPEQRHRRSLYALKLRGLNDPALEVFNAPSPDFSCEQREASTVTPQVFALFNSKASAARALALAARVLKETPTDEAAIHRCFQLVYGRQAKAEEVRTCLAHWQELQTVQAKATFVSEKPPLAIRREAVEENTGEKFSFNETLHANAEFVPDLQPADCDPRTRALADVCHALLNTNEFAYVY
jgi:mono/diheme cytochrome c family protein